VFANAGRRTLALVGRPAPSDLIDVGFVGNRSIAAGVWIVVGHNTPESSVEINVVYPGRGKF